ncbi:hypothetical protein Bra471DRAFT_06174 [Bradyrhizobium sp. WSM471]|nr:hypothetical protein Bra471DRAFT_06174 [Bradyrhizobium sp. WSM471]
MARWSAARSRAARAAFGTFPDYACAPSGYATASVSPPVNPRTQKYSALPKFGFVVCVGHPGSSLRGDLVVVLIASRACSGRGSVGMRGAGRAGSPCEPATACGRAALLGFVSSVSFRLGRQGWKNCGEMAGRAYGKTVWSWPSLLRSSFRGGVCEPNRADSIIQIREAREARRKVRLPGEHGISRPTIAQGRPSDWHHLYAAVRFSCVCFSRSGPRVRGQHPAFPAPSWTRGWNDQAKLGRNAPRG